MPHLVSSSPSAPFRGLRPSRLVRWARFNTIGGSEEDVGEGLLLVAIGCGRLQGMLETAASRGFVVFGAMETEIFAGLAAAGAAAREAPGLPVHFYETG